MTWTPIADAMPSAEVLIYAEGRYYLGVLVSDGDPTFLDIHSGDILPWPSHWMELPPPPG